MGKEGIALWGFGNLWDLITTSDLQDLPMWKSSWTPASPTLWFATLYLLHLSEHIMFSIETLNSLMWKLTHMEKSYFPDSWSNIFHMFERYYVVYTELTWTHTTYNLCYGTRYILKWVRIQKKRLKGYIIYKKNPVSFISDRNCGKEFGLFCRCHIFCEWFWSSTNTKHVEIHIASPFI